jgi:hypothetical protein
MQIRFHAMAPGDFPPRTSTRVGSSFTVSWTRALEDLERELAYLGARDVVISVGLREEDIRLDGWPRSGAKATHPGVIVSFDSKHGPLRYFCDEYAEGHNWTTTRYLTGYQANLRAIALGLAALRAVDRYGITRRGEQYTGWKALPQGNGPVTRQEAEQVIRRFAMKAGYDVMIDEEPDAIRKALFASHPDHGGTTEDFDLVQQARRILDN